MDYRIKKSFQSIKALDETKRKLLLYNPCPNKTNILAILTCVFFQINFRIILPSFPLKIPFVL